MFIYIALLILADVLGKLIWGVPAIRILFISLLFLVGTFVFLLKFFRFVKKETNRVLNILFNLFFWCVYMTISIPFVVGLLKRISDKYDIYMDYYLSAGVFFMFCIYFILSLLIIYLLSHVEKIVNYLVGKFRSINITILYSIIIALIIIISEVFSSIVFYYSSYQSYHKHLFEEKLKASSVEQQVSYELVEDLIDLHTLSFIKNLHFLELSYKLEKLYIQQNKSLPEQFLTEKTKVELKTEESVIPQFKVLLILFKFSFYQHFVLGLDDHLTNFQKYIATNLNTSILQMLHIVFIRIIDLIIIGKIVTFTSWNNEKRNDQERSCQSST